MPSKERIKGFNYERAIVKELNVLPNIKAQRMWGSTGKARGLPDEVDLLIDIGDSSINAQCKNWASENIPMGFKSFMLNILDNVEVGFIKREGMAIEHSYVVMDLKAFKYIINKVMES
jgi:hypothetical protein